MFVLNPTATQIWSPSPNTLSVLAKNFCTPAGVTKNMPVT